MRSFWSEPYLWVHLAGIAAVPLFLELCFLGLAVGDPLLPVWVEVLLVGLVGIAPTVWMQWQRPFCIFSLLAVALKPEVLTEEQRRLLRLFRSDESRFLTLGASALMLLVLWQLYRFAPIASHVAPFPPQARVAGLALAAIAFLGANLFLQVPVSVVRVLWASDAQVAALAPYPAEQVGRDFLLPGLRVKRILPILVPDVTMPVQPETVSPTTIPTLSPPPSPIAPSPVVEESSTLEVSPWDEIEDVSSDENASSSAGDTPSPIATEDPSAPSSTLTLGDKETAQAPAPDAVSPPSEDAPLN